MITHPRRGMLLLVVLALLAMFAMVAVAFVVLTGTERRSADRLRTVEPVDDRRKRRCERGLRRRRSRHVHRSDPTRAQPLPPSTGKACWKRSTASRRSAPRITRRRWPQFFPVCGGQLIEFTLPTNNPDPTTFGGATVDPFHCVGCVVTMLSGPAAGLSSRIVGINPTNYNVQMAAFDGGVQPANGDQYIVNGFPYSGMGFGLTTTAAG